MDPVPPRTVPRAQSQHATEATHTHSMIAGETDAATYDADKLTDKEEPEIDSEADDEESEAPADACYPWVLDLSCVGGRGTRIAANMIVCE